MKDVTFIIPYMEDSLARAFNLSYNLEYLLKKFPSSRFILKEAYLHHINNKFSRSRCTHLTEKINTTTSFHKTKYINDCLKHVDTPIACVVDVDCLTHEVFYHNAVSMINTRESDSVVMGTRIRKINPSDNEMIDEEWDRFVVSDYNDFDVFKPTGPDDMNGRHHGGIVFTRTSVYKDIGGENEAFRNWSSEDTERYIRLEKLGYKNHRLAGILYHMEHPCGTSSRDCSNDQTAAALKLWNEMKDMTREQLLKYYEPQIVRMKEYGISN